MSDILFVQIAHAETTVVAKLLGRVNRVIINPLIILMFSLALCYFLYGVLEFFMNSDKADAKETGRQHMIWGIIGMFIMMSVFTIMRILAKSFGFEVEV
jgi:hypothetical protein